MQAFTTSASSRSKTQWKQILTNPKPPSTFCFYLFPHKSLKQITDSKRSFYTWKPQEFFPYSLQPKFPTFITFFHGLSISISTETRPDPRPTIFPNDGTADKLLKLLLPSLKFIDFLDFLCLGEE